MKGSAAVCRVKVSADGHGVVSHTGVGCCARCRSGGCLGRSQPRWRTRTRGRGRCARGCVHRSGCRGGRRRGLRRWGRSLWGDREHAFGPVASTTTLWRLVDERIGAARLPRIRAARAHARERAWAAGAAPAHDGWLHIDVDATITVDHSDNKENAAATWKHTFGFHSLLMFLVAPHRRRGGPGRAAAGGQRRQ